MRFRRGPQEGLGFEGSPGAGSSGGSPPPPTPPPSPLTPPSTDDSSASSDLPLPGEEESPSSSLWSSPSPCSSPPLWSSPSLAGVPWWFREEVQAREDEYRYLRELKEQEHNLLTNLYSINPEFHSQLRPDDTSEQAAPFNFTGKVGNKECVMALADDFGNDNNIIKQKIRLLRDKYDFFRRTDKDGNCFYRAFIFNYLENIAEIRDAAEREIEAARLRQCFQKSEQAYRSLGYLRMPEAQILRASNGFKNLVHLVEAGLNSEVLYEFEKDGGITLSVLPLLRFLTEIEICTREEFYKDFLPEYASVFEFCREEVRPENSEANDMQTIALVNALGIPLVLENLDASSNNGAVELNQHYRYPRLESEADQMLGPLNLHGSVSCGGTCCMESVSSESMELLDLPCTTGPSTSRSMPALELLSIDTDSTPSQDGSGEQHGGRNLLPAERRRLVTLLYRPGHYDILYPK